MSLKKIGWTERRSQAGFAILRISLLESFSPGWILDAWPSTTAISSSSPCGAVTLKPQSQVTFFFEAMRSWALFPALKHFVGFWTRLSTFYFSGGAFRYQFVTNDSDFTYILRCASCFTQLLLVDHHIWTVDDFLPSNLTPFFSSMENFTPIISFQFFQIDT